jgi:HTH-type transcriptional regulator/antitoxin HigA
MAQLAIIDAYERFMTTAHSFVNIESESDYKGALEALETIFESANDELDDPLNPLIDLLSHAIERYESQDQELLAFIAESEGITTDIALLQALMQHHELTGSDLPEIGDKTLVSRVLSGKRPLTRGAMERLAERFGIRAGMFLDGETE